jgi:3-methyladenine DNA glycosylase AlkD
MMATNRGQAVKDALAWLERRGTKRNVQGLSRYGIQARKAFGVPVGTIKQLGKKLGTDHDLALALWKTGWYEARLLAAFVGDPARLTVAQMNAWCRDFENWGDCDTVCFHLFDKTPHAWGRITAWSRKRGEFEKRASFALLASVALHDKHAPDAPFVRSLTLIERAAADDRNFVKKAVSWALRGIAKRNKTMHRAAVASARRLAARDGSARWVGLDVLRELT